MANSNTDTTNPEKKPTSVGSFMASENPTLPEGLVAILEQRLSQKIPENANAEERERLTQEIDSARTLLEDNNTAKNIGMEIRQKRIPEDTAVLVDNTNLFKTITTRLRPQALLSITRLIKNEGFKLQESSLPKVSRIYTTDTEKKQFLDYQKAALLVEKLIEVVGGEMGFILKIFKDFERQNNYAKR